MHPGERLVVGLCLGWVMLCAQPAQAQTWTLAAVVRETLARNPDIALARARIDEAAAQLAQARAAFMPQLGLSSQYHWTNNPLMAFGSILNQRSFTPDLDFNDVPAVDDLHLRATVRLPLYAGGSRPAQRARARARRAGRRAEAEARRQALVLAAAQNYYTLLKTRAWRQSAAAAVAALKTHHRVAMAQVAAGALLASEALRIEVELSAAREAAVQADSAAALSAAALCQLMGRRRCRVQLPATVTEPAAVQPGRRGPERAELTAGRQAVRAAEASARQAKAGYLPALDAVASVDTDYGWRRDGGQVSYIAGLRLQWSLWDGQATRARLDEAQARVAQAQAHWRQRRLAVDHADRTARVRLREAETRLQLQDKAITSAQKQVALERARLAHGAAVAQALIDAERALTAARMRQAEAEAERRMAQVALRHALGLPPVDAAVDASAPRSP